jgi:hypothetical protein
MGSRLASDASRGSRGNSPSQEFGQSAISYALED